LHEYYRRTVHKRTVYEDLLGLAHARELPSGGRGDLAIGTTDSHEERHKILATTEAWVHRPLGIFSVVGGFRLTLSILAVLHLLGAALAVALAFGFQPRP
jgi:hypothetical protein